MTDASRPDVQGVSHRSGRLASVCTNVPHYLVNPIFFVFCSLRIAWNCCDTNCSVDQFFDIDSNLVTFFFGGVHFEIYPLMNSHSLLLVCLCGKGCGVSPGLTWRQRMQSSTSCQMSNRGQRCPRFDSLRRSKQRVTLRWLLLCLDDLRIPSDTLDILPCILLCIYYGRISFGTLRRWNCIIWYHFIWYQSHCLTYSYIVILRCFMHTMYSIISTHPSACPYRRSTPDTFEMTEKCDVSVGPEWLTHWTCWSERTVATRGAWLIGFV